MVQAAFRRGQVEHVLWYVLTPIGGTTPHREFRSRLKRLIDFDRYGAPGFTPIGPVAFTTETDGPGTDARYSESNVLLLGLALQLIDSGFSVLEAVYLMQHVGAGCLKCMLRIVNRGIPYSRLDIVGDRSLPKRPNGEADPRVFMLINKHEFREYFAGGSKKSEKTPRISAPRIINGSKALAEDLDEEMGFQKKNVLIIELWSLVMRIHSSLADPPDIRRGRR